MATLFGFRVLFSKQILCHS